MKMVLKNTSDNSIKMVITIPNEGAFQSQKLEEQFQKFVYKCVDTIQEEIELTRTVKSFEIIDIDVYSNLKTKAYESTIDVYDLTKPVTEKDFNESNVLFRAELTTA